MKYKVGDKVKLVRLNRNEKGLPQYEHNLGKLFTIKKIENGCNWCYVEETDTIIPFLSDLELFKDIEVGDTVRIRKDITLEDLTKNYWNGCQIETMDFLKRACHSDFDNEYKVTAVNEKWLKVEGYDLHINVKLFELVKKKEVKEMTIEEISEALGYEVKVVKGGK